MKNVIACSKNWFENYTSTKFKKKFYFIRKKSDLNMKNLKKIKPKYIFFPHWSHKVPQIILDSFECICFHTSPLPYGRGGSPIQNLIQKKIQKAPVCALRMVAKIDAGPIYCKKVISLTGNLNEIFNRITPAIQHLIKIIIIKKPKPRKQKGKIKIFKRIKPEKSHMIKEKSLSKIYDRIRMLDHDEYPRAFLKIGKYKVEFKDPLLKKKYIVANAVIKKSN